MVRATLPHHVCEIDGVMLISFFLARSSVCVRGMIERCSVDALIDPDMSVINFDHRQQPHQRQFADEHVSCDSHVTLKMSSCVGLCRAVCPITSISSHFTAAPWPHFSAAYYAQHCRSRTCNACAGLSTQPRGPLTRVQALIDDVIASHSSEQSDLPAGDHHCGS